MAVFTLEFENIDALGAFSRLYAMPYSLFLDSADTAHQDARYSYVAFMPVETIEAKDGEILLSNMQGQERVIDADPFAFVQKRLRKHRLSILRDQSLPPFQGGAAGFYGYDLARSLEDLPRQTRENAAMPDMAIGIYDQVFAYDHKTGKGLLMVHAEAEKDASLKFAHFERMMAQAIVIPDYMPFEPAWSSNHTRESYAALVQKVVDYIHAGDIFQANLSQRFDADLPANFHPFSHYLNMRAVNPAPFASYFNLGHIVISSASPERFVTLVDGAVETKPIKGTRPHVPDQPAIDTLYRNMLENSDKDRSENVMIVDLLRNDLSKVCRPDSVKVTKLCSIETFSHVYHLVSTVKGIIRQGLDGIDLLRACFPGGSITGAPKVRAMEIIEELEDSVRGPYCGSIAYNSFDGGMDSSILIRTLVFEGHHVSFQVGGGIVAASNPAEEYEETLVKAQGLFDSFTRTGKMRRAAPQDNADAVRKVA